MFTLDKHFVFCIQSIPYSIQIGYKKYTKKKIEMLGSCCNLLEPSHSIPGFYFVFLATTQLEKEREKKKREEEKDSRTKG